MRHVNDRDWTKFCNGPLKYFETKWTKKLEDYDKTRSESSSHEDHESGSDEEKDQNVFAESKKGGSHSNTGSRKDRYRVDSKDDDDDEGDDDEQESIIESLLKSDKFNNKKREPIKSVRPTREELD
jgi:hypothetical protein